MYPAGHNMAPKRTMLLDFEDTVDYLGLNRADIINPRCDGNETEILLISNSFPFAIPCKTMTIQRPPPRHLSLSLFGNRFLWVIQRNLVHGEVTQSLQRKWVLESLHSASAPVDRMPGTKRRQAPCPHPPMPQFSVKLADTTWSMLHVWSNDS